MITCFASLRRMLLPVSLLIAPALVAGNTRPSILLLGSAHGMGAYTAEMLKTEGFHSFTYRSLENDPLSASDLTGVETVVLPALSLTVAADSLLVRFVRRGGHLIAFRPAAALRSVLGLGMASAETATGGYLSIRNKAATGRGFTADLLQWHGAADIFAAWPGADVSVLADFHQNRLSPSTAPAIVRRAVGKGQATVFFYDLPLSILLTRQGNPQLAAEETDSINGIRAMDMFTGGWVDTANNTLNQADEQLHFFSRCVETGASRSGPLPRLWYFPGNLTSLVALTNDGEFRSENEFRPQFADVAALQAGMTLYVLSPEKISAWFADSLTRLGFEIAAHPDATAQAGAPSWEGVNKAIADKIAAVRSLLGVPAIRTNTNHWFVWCGKDSTGATDFSAGARIEARNGIRMDVNYAHYDNKAGTPRFLGPTGYRQGNFTGSGLPMKFGSLQGDVIDVYQLFNNVYDQQYMENKDADGYEACFRGLLDRSLTHGVYSYLCIRAHNDEYFFSKAPLGHMLEYAAEKKVPVWPVKKVLEFVSARDNTSFDGFRWQGRQLSFQINSPVAAGAPLTLMLPATFQGRGLTSVKRNGVPWTGTIHDVAGNKYWWGVLMAGKNARIEASYAGQ